MSDLEERLSRMLAERADASPVAAGLAEGARVRHRRRRALRVGAAGAAVAVAIVAVPVGLGALSIDEGEEVSNQPEPVVSGVPASWGFESYRNVEIGVESANLLSSEGISEPADLESLWLGLNSAERGTTYKLNAQVMYWAMPRGGSAFDGSVPLPKQLRP